MGDSLFPQWIDRVRPLAGALVVVVPVYLVAVVYYGGSPRTTDVGYAPKQPVPFSHAVHVGQLKLDCRYCHTNVETGDKPPLGVERDGSTRPRVPSFAKIAIPSTEVCMNCHQRVAPDSPKLQPVRDSAATGQAVPWVRVHDLPDYVYFDHS
ncbi:MAG: cytochrome c family protein, partial [Thermoguttaceae bacterium]|nr:cytochrome c family protein [Thermoguttaceae bacterium]